MILNAFGKACPMPLVMAKKELDAGCTDLGVQVDNETAVKNLLRLGDKSGLAVGVDEIEGGWLVSFSGAPDGNAAASAAAEAPVAPVCGPSGCGYAVFVGKDHVGEGDPQLGYNLMKIALYTLSEGEQVPASVLFMNGGVKLVAGEETPVVESVRKLQERGSEVLVCGTCLDFYGIKGELLVGDVSNMYDILERMHEAAKVITL